MEATTTTWDKIWIKLQQSARDCASRGLDTPVVWKKRDRTTDPGEGVILMPAKIFWADRADLEAYRRREMDMQDQFERGYELGRKEREATA